MYSHGRALAGDALVGLFCDAMTHAAAMLHRDASTRRPDEGLASQADVEERIAAACLGAAAAFSLAARLGGGGSG